MVKQLIDTGFEIMGEGASLPERSLQQQKWSRRAIMRFLEIGSSNTLYKWEFEMHSNLLRLPHSFIIWEFIIKQDGSKKILRPPLDDYQIECLFLLGSLRKSPATNTTIEQTIKDNELMFFELHQIYSPLHPKKED